MKRALMGVTARHIGLLVVLWGLFFWRLLTPVDGDRVLFAPGDFQLHFFGFIDYEIERWSNGELPLWNPYNYGGEPFAANVQFAAWYPLRWLSALVTGASGWRIEAFQMEVAAHYLLSSLAMVLFLRVLLRHALAALVGGVLWGYSAYLTGYPMLQPGILYALTWLPLMLLGMHLSLTDARWRVGGIVVSGVGMGLSVLGGHTQTTMQAVYFTAAYGAVLGWQQRVGWRAVAWRIALMGGIGAGLSAVQLWPAFEMMQRTVRFEGFTYDDKAMGFRLIELAHVVWPRLFGALWWPLYPGVIGLLLAIGAMLRAGQKQVFWIGAAAVSLVLSLGGATPLFDALYVALPGVSVFRHQERVIGLAIFALAVLAAMQAARLFPQGETLVGDRSNRRWWWPVGGHLALTWAVFLVAAVDAILRGGGTLKPDTQTDALGLIALLSLGFAAWLVGYEHGRGGPLIAAALVGLIVLDLFSFGMKSPNFVPDRPENRVQPPDFLDVLSVPYDSVQWHVDGGVGIQTYGTYWRIPDIYGTVPFALESMDRLRGLRVDARWEVFAVRYATMFEDLPGGVALTSLGTGTNLDGRSYTLYELDDPRPFAHLVFDAVRVEDDDAARAFMNLDWANLRERAVVTRDLPVTLPGARPDGARVEAFSMTQPEYLEMDVTTPEPALLTLPVAYYPGWRATINGQKAERVEVYAGLTGIVVPPGERMRVVLEYRPISVLGGAAISAVTLLAVSGYGIAALVRAMIARQRGREHLHRG